MLKQAWHILHSFALSLHTGMVYPCTVGAPHLPPPPVPHRFLFFWGGLRYTPCSPLSSSRERAPLPPINGVDNASPPTGLFLHAGGQPRQYDCLIQRFSLWSGFMPPVGRHSHPTAGRGDCRAAVSGYHPLLLSSRCALPLPSREDVQHEGERQPPRRGRGRYGYVSTISSSVGFSGADTPPRHVSWHGRQSYSSAGILSASEPSMSIICLRMASLY